MKNAFNKNLFLFKSIYGVILAKAICILEYGNKTYFKADEL